MQFYNQAYFSLFFCYRNSYIQFNGHLNRWKCTKIGYCNYKSMCKTFHGLDNSKLFIQRNQIWVIYWEYDKKEKSMRLRWLEIIDELPRPITCRLILYSADVRILKGKYSWSWIFKFGINLALSEIIDDIYRILYY